MLIRWRLILRGGIPADPPVELFRYKEPVRLSFLEIIVKEAILFVIVLSATWLGLRFLAPIIK